MTREEAIKILDNDTPDTSDDWCSALDMAIQALKQEPCEDAISRQDVIAEIYDKYMSSDGAVYNDTAKEIFGIIRNQPPVTPARPKGKWLYTDDSLIPECSICCKWSDVLQGNAEFNYCPNCGADMREAKNSDQAGTTVIPKDSKRDLVN